MDPIYLDYNATTPIDPVVAQAMLPFIHEHFGNPSSSHVYGVTTKKAVEKARRQVADMLHCEPEEVFFTSGGSESNNTAIKGVAYAYREKGDHIVTSAIEHPAVTEVCAFLERHGFRITTVPVDGEGMVDPAEVERAITPATILVTVMHANNEVGTIQRIRDIARIAHARDVLVHTDAAQSVGKIPVRTGELEVDLLSIAGHKLYAPKGIGALFVRTGVRFEKLIHGAAHEMNLRAGTENVIEIVGLGEACELVNRRLDDYAASLKMHRDLLEEGLRNRYPDLRVNGHPRERLPNTSSVSFRGLEANTILAELEAVAASAGAACHTDRVDVSSVLKAMRVPIEYAMGTIRFSTGRFTTEEEVRRALEEIASVVDRLSPHASALPPETPAGGVRLTQYTHGLGCACKLRPQLLEQVLKRIPPTRDENVLVGVDTSDDAAVYRIDAHTAVVETVDFFTPVLDDPFEFGAVAAANSLSDIYAMGARPLFALSVVGFPSNRLPMEVLEEILRGATSVTDLAGISIIGGHTVDDTEPKFGLVVTGLVDPDRVVTNRGARPGDALILTKPIGTGILSTAMKQGLLDEIPAEDLFKTMSALNRDAAEAMMEEGAHACTDVTGFGLLGHLMEMMRGSGTAAQINASAVPILAGAQDLATGGVLPGGSRDNLDYTAPHTRYDDRVSNITRMLLNDAQTSGGLLIALPEERAGRLMERLAGRGVERAALIGKVTGGAGGTIEVHP